MIISFYGFLAVQKSMEIINCKIVCHLFAHLSLHVLEKEANYWLHFNAVKYYSTRHSFHFNMLLRSPIIYWTNGTLDTETEELRAWEKGKYLLTRCDNDQFIAPNCSKSSWLFTWTEKQYYPFILCNTRIFLDHWILQVNKYWLKFSFLEIDLNSFCWHMNACLLVFYKIQYENKSGTAQSH